MENIVNAKYMFFQNSFIHIHLPNAPKPLSKTNTKTRRLLNKKASINGSNSISFTENLYLLSL